MCSRNLVLGIDTSNYTTSLACTDLGGAILLDIRELLIVKQGERGLRQSEALFQHMENIPDMITKVFNHINKDKIGAIAVSNRPRPVEGSYMPVFKAGLNYGRILAASLGVPLFEFSHQEGHLESAMHNNCIERKNEFLAYHLSGGTCELLSVKNQSINIIGGSKDISFGQVIDRIGVTLDMKFPAGKEMDAIAAGEGEKRKNSPENNKKDRSLKRIPIDGLYINLSGIETQCQRELLKSGQDSDLIYELFLKISDCLCKLTEKAAAETGCKDILFTGGVSASQFIRSEINHYFEGKEINIIFGNTELSSDNAVGISLLGGKNLCQ